MCGIAGIWQLNSGVNDINDLRRMLAVQGYRGPEGAGYTTMDDGNLMLGFLKLGFTDTPDGIQPLFNEDGTIALVYNGEIYGYQKVRDDLIERGHKFYTQSDSEVLIHLYEEYGLDFINSLNGEFAFALFDGRKDQLILARDPFGVNPLCYAMIDGQFVFSSEAKGILSVPGFPREANPAYFGTVGIGIPNTSTTFFKYIHSLTPGHYMLVSRSGIKTIKYWNPKFEKCQDSVEVAREKVKQKLIDAVSKRLHDNPPLALCLSSGIDSTIIASITRHLERSYPAFSLAFTGRNFDEGATASRYCNDLGIVHYPVEVSLQQLADNFVKALWHTENTTNSLSNSGRLLNAKEIRNAGYKAVMGGESSDELFGGYPFFVMEYLWRQVDAGNLNSGRYREFEKKEKLSRRIFWDNPGDRARRTSPYLSHHTAYMRAEKASRISGWIWSEDICSQNVRSAAEYFMDEIPPADVSNLHPFDISRVMARSVASTFVYPQLGDRLEMANSLEGRVPFLDKELMEYVYSLPEGYFIDEQSLTGKRLLREAFGQFLPSSFSPPAKHTYMAPTFRELMHVSAFKKLFDEYLNSDRIKNSGVINAGTLRFVRYLWRLPVLYGSLGLFIDSLIGVFLSAQILFEQFIIQDPLRNTKWQDFEMRKVQAIGDTIKQSI